MRMPVVDIRKVWVAMADLHVLMNMAMRTSPTPLKRVLVLMMLVVNVAMPMRQRYVLVLVRVAFSKVEPYPNSHQRSGWPKRQRHRLAHSYDCDGGS